MKCRAPHGSSWGGIGYHNAMVSSVYQNDDTEIKNMQDIKVRKNLLVILNFTIYTINLNEFFEA